MEQLIKDINKRFLEKETLLNDNKIKYKSIIQKLKKEKQQENFAKEAHEILRKLAQTTQEQIQNYISNIVTIGINTIFETKDKFIIEFEQKRNQVEVQFWIENKENRINPFDADGGGLCDLISFLLRIAFWSIERKGQVIILDEPFKHLSQDLHEKMSYLLKKLSTTLNLQFIIVSHSQEINAIADKYFLVQNGEIR